MSRPESSQYNAFADGYADHAETAPYNALLDRPAVFGLLGDLAGQRVFDAACGSGIYAETMLDAGASVVGCDGSERLVELATQRTSGRAEFRTHSLDEPIEWVEAGSIDVVLCALAYHYLNDRPALLRSAHRMLADDGRMIISTHHPVDDWYRLGGSYFTVDTVTERWSRGWDVTTWRMPLSVLTEEFADAGFLIEWLIEPRPLPAMEVEHPTAYERLLTVPAFIVFQLIKRPAATRPQQVSPAS